MPWAPLADADPIPGDAEAVARLAARLKETAEAIRRQTMRLKAMDTGGEFWQGEAAQAFAERKEQLPGLFERLSSRYEAVGQPSTATIPSSTRPSARPGRRWPKRAQPRMR